MTLENVLNAFVNNIVVTVQSSAGGQPHRGKITDLRWEGGVRSFIATVVNDVATVDLWMAFGANGVQRGPSGPDPLRSATKRLTRAN